MLTPRPDKFRGARAYAALAANVATFGGLIYLPPASGAFVTKANCDQASQLYVGSFAGGSGAPLPAFTNGLALTTLNLHAHWGPDYAPTGVVQGGQFAAGLPESFIDSFVLVNLGVNLNPLLEFDVFPPNVVVMAARSANTAVHFALEFREYLSAEELKRWSTGREA